MQIEVVDDHSTDSNVAEIVREVGRGRVSYYRQEKNVGSLRNFHTCLKRSRGHLIHLLHGDDLVLPGFYSRMEQFFKQESLGAAFCRYSYIDEQGEFLWNHKQEMEHQGVLPGWLERISEQQRIQYVAMVVKREVYERLGGFYGAEYGEDWEMWARIAAHYPVGYIPDILASYRRHRSSISGRSFLTAQNMKELEWAMSTIKNYLPEEKRQTVLSSSRKFYAHYALRVANGLWAELRNKRGAEAQAKAAWSMQKDPFLFFKIVKLYTRMTLNI